MLTVADRTGTGASVLLLALRLNAVAMALPKPPRVCCVASCGSVPGGPEAGFAALARMRAARELPRVWDGGALRVCAEGPVDFWPDAVLPSVPGVLPVWPEPAAVALPVAAFWLGSVFGSLLALLAGVPVAGAEKGVLAGIELPSVNVPVLIPT